MMFDNTFPPKGTKPELVRKIARANEQADPLLGEPLAENMPQHMKDLIMKIRRTVAKQERIVGEMQADVLEIEQLTDEGYVDGAFPVDEEMATDADANLRDLKELDEETVRQESEWAREDAQRKEKKR